MNRLEHINLVVKNINSTLGFIQTAFPDWYIRGEGESEWFGKQRHWLHVGTDDYYITLNEGGDGENRDLNGHTIGLAHIGFCVDDLDSLCSRLQNKGYEIDIIAAEHPYRKSLYFIEPGGYQFEFIQYLSSVASERNRYGGETSEVKYCHSNNNKIIS